MEIGGDATLEDLAKDGVTNFGYILEPDGASSNDEVPGYRVWATCNHYGRQADVRFGERGGGWKYVYVNEETNVLLAGYSAKVQIMSSALIIGGVKFAPFISE